jgi:hypothetical protein
VTAPTTLTTNRAEEKEMPEPWFATSPFGLDQAPEATGPMDPLLYLVHAKTVGTSRSACGQDASGWQKHWAAFDTVPHDRACPDCAAAATVGVEASA